MWQVSLADAALALGLALWLRSLLRARGDAVPCTPRVASPALVAAGTAALVGAVVVNVLVLRSMGHLGKHLQPLEFIVWLAAMSAVSILFILATTARHVNREARRAGRRPPAEPLFCAVLQGPPGRGRPRRRGSMSPRRPGAAGLGR